MKSMKSDRLHELCSRALIEKDPQKTVVLFTEINGILSEIVSQVNHVLREKERADRFSHPNRAEASAGRYIC
jgi:hypothetical protein